MSRAFSTLSRASAFAFARMTVAWAEEFCAISAAALLISFFMRSVSFRTTCVEKHNSGLKPKRNQQLHCQPRFAVAAQPSSQRVGFASRRPRVSLSLIARLFFLDVCLCSAVLNLLVKRLN